MEKLHLKLIGIEDKDIVIDYVRELVSHGSNRDGVWYEESTSFEEMLSNLKEHESTPYTSYEQEKPVCYQYLLLRDADLRLVGMVSIRPYLTRRLDETFGGNIGYSIRPSERRKGYATMGLSLAVTECRKLNPTNSDIMVCCYRDNIGSRKAILKNGGTLIETKEGIIPHEKYIIK